MPTAGFWQNTLTLLIWNELSPSKVFHVKIPSNAIQKAIFSLVYQYLTVLPISSSQLRCQVAPLLEHRTVSDEDRLFQKV